MYNNNDCYPDHGDPYSPGNGGASGPGITGNSSGNTACGSGCDGSDGGGSHITYVNSVVVSPKNITLKTDTYYYQFCASVLPTNASNQNLRWESADPCIASVNGAGDWICANNIGTTTIYANATDGSGCLGYLTVTVSNTVAATSVILSTYHLKLKLGQQSTVSATVLPLTATNRGVDWTSSDPGIAAVEDGVITACAVGSAKIYATASDGSGRRAVCSVTVTSDAVATSISVRAEESALLVGKSTRCWASVCPEEYDDSCVTWSSDDPCVASVSPNDGIVLALSAGVATIRATATDGSGVFGTVQIRVSAPILAEFITVCPETLTLDVGDTVGLFADICPANATSKRIRWTSDDSYIASVDAVSGCVTAKSGGSTCIHAHAQDGSEVSAYCEVVVNACCCSTNTSMETARDIDIESLVSGTINDSDGEQWFKFTVPQTDVYTIYTTGSLDTVGCLYDSNGNIFARVDDHEASGKSNFRIIEELQANQTYYVRVTAATSDTGSYYLKVTQKTLVDSISINLSEITLEHIGKVYELPILPNTFVGIENAEPLSTLIASTIPSSANEKRVTWLSFDHDIIRIDTGSYNGQTYQTLTVLGTGTAKLYAWDWNDDGKRGECTVIVNSREQITVEQDGLFNKIVFGNSGKTWYSLNFDYVNDWDTLNADDLYTIRDRLYRSTYETVNWVDNGFMTSGAKLYSEKEMRLLYVLDPLGFASYVQEYAKHTYSNLLDNIAFKDSVFVTLFGKTPKYYARNTDGDWYDATSEKDDLSIHKILSEAELLFGTHPIYDYKTVREMFATVLQILTLPVSFASLAHIAVPKVYTVFLKCMNLKFSIWQAEVEGDFEKYIEAIKTATESETETKSSDFNLNWALQLFKLSDNFGELAEVLADKPSFYREMFNLCANNEDYRIIFEYNSGTTEDASNISNKLN